MTLGEKIYELRTQHNLSQGDLANKLDVSRQSISKWENGNSTPDLEKIVKLADIFNVSLDELIKNEEKEETIVDTPEASLTSQSNTREKKIGKGLLIAGIISIVLFLFSGFGFTWLLVAIPLFICSIIHYKAKNDHLFYCLWVIIPLADLFIRFAMGISWSMIKETLEWNELLNPGRLVIAWVQFIVISCLILFSIIKLSKRNIDINKKFKSNFIAAFIGFIFLLAGELLTQPFFINLLADCDDINSIEYKTFVVANIIFNLFDWLRIYLFVDLVTKAVQYIKLKKSI
jgi:transcriptional regulator with XRE-family HTH domain